MSEAAHGAGRQLEASLLAAERAAMNQTEPAPVATPSAFELDRHARFSKICQCGHVIGAHYGAFTSIQLDQCLGAGCACTTPTPIRGHRRVV